MRCYSARVFEGREMEMLETLTFSCREGHTALHLAAFGNHTDMLQLLLESGADVTEKDK